MKKTRLDQVAKVEISGVDKKTKPGQQIVRLCNFTDVYYNWAITQDMHDTFKVASASQKEIDSLALQKGQVALTKDSETRDDIGISTYIADDFEDVVLGYHTALITPDETKLNGKYLNAFLHTSYMQKYFSFNASGSGQRYTLSTEALNAIQLILPTLEEQERIGNLFSLLDRKISLNRSINEELERMAKEIYDYWFVQFDFPDEHGRPYKSSGGAMVYNPVLKREVPAGWEVKNLDYYLSSISERTSIIEDSHANYTPIEVIPRKKMSFHETVPLEKAVSGLCKYNKKDILLSNRRVYFHKVSIVPFNGVTRDTVIILRPKFEDSLGYSFQLVNSDHFIAFATKHSYGSEQPVLSWETAKKYKVCVPPKDIVLSYNRKISSCIDSILDNEIESGELTKLRDELLPLLMTGQVKIK